MNQDNLSYIHTPPEKAYQYIKDLEDMLHIAIDCLDNIITTQANSAKYRKMAKESLTKILENPHAQTRNSK